MHFQPDALTYEQFVSNLTQWNKPQSPVPITCGNGDGNGDGYDSGYSSDSDQITQKSTQRRKRRSHGCAERGMAKRLKAGSDVKTGHTAAKEPKTGKSANPSAKAKSPKKAKPTLQPNSKKITKPVKYASGKRRAPPKGMVHLWYFVRELLDYPQLCQCLKWVDREKGVFKIFDGQEMARLWGLRKNCPNMTYENLSRSLRQYYKKRILAKPLKSQKMVYRFLWPYSL